MSKQIASIPRGDIARVKIYLNMGRLPLSEVVAQEGPDVAITGNFWDYGTWLPVCPLKADGKVLCSDPEYNYPALEWDTGEDIHLALIPPGGASAKANYIANGCGIYGGDKQDLYYKADVAGRRGRAGWGFLGGELALIAFPDGSDGMTPEELRDYAFEMGFTDFIMGDGGRKVNYYNKALGVMLQGKDPSQNLILIYLRRGAPAEPSDSGSDGERTNNEASESSPSGGGEGYGVCEDEKEDKPVSAKYTVCLDPGHGPGCVNGSPDGSYKEFEFAWDIYGRVKALLEANDVAVVGTKDERGYPSLTERAGVSNKAKADLFVSLHSNASGQGWTDPSGLVIYTSETGDTAGRNKAARAILARMRTAGVDIFGGGLGHKGYTVLTATNAPAMIVEYGFHTNRGDVELLKDSAHRDKLARATAAGICDYLGLGYKEDSGASGMPRPTEDTAANWAALAWERARKAGILDGTRPTEAVTRQELAVALDRLKLI